MLHRVLFFFFRPHSENFNSEMEEGKFLSRALCAFLGSRAEMRGEAGAVQGISQVRAALVQCSGRVLGTGTGCQGTQFLRSSAEVPAQPGPDPALLGEARRLGAEAVVVWVRCCMPGPCSNPWSSPQPRHLALFSVCSCCWSQPV